MASSTTADDGAHGHPTGLRRFLFSTNHKDIGTLYIILAMIGGVVGTLMSIAIRVELMHPASRFSPGWRSCCKESILRWRWTAARIFIMCSSPLTAC